MAETKEKKQLYIDFIRLRWITFLISGLIMVSSIGLMATKGLNFGIDFTGGTLIEIRLEKPTDIATLRQGLGTLNLGAISIQEFGTPEDILIRLPQQPGSEDDQKKAIDSVKEYLGKTFETIDYRRVEYVGPQVGKELKWQGLYAILLAIAAMLAYIAIRFEWKFGLAAIIALVHDAIATLGLFSLTSMEFSLSTVAAVLLISGYSINDTVIVFDRIRENLRKFKKMPLDHVLNNAISQTLSRTIITSFTTLLALLALWMFGGEVIQSFTDALLFGILIGTYSSIFVASPLLYMMGIQRRAETASKYSDTEVVS